jgi:fatty acid-binding protein DegV
LPGIESLSPLYINLGGQSYLDGVDLTREAFYVLLPEADPPPTTAVPVPRMFVDVYDGLGDEGASEILSVHISRRLSAVGDTAGLNDRNR